MTLQFSSKWYLRARESSYALPAYEKFLTASPLKQFHGRDGGKGRGKVWGGGGEGAEKHLIQNQLYIATIYTGSNWIFKVLLTDKPSHFNTLRSLIAPTIKSDPERPSAPTQVLLEWISFLLLSRIVCEQLLNGSFTH